MNFILNETSVSSVTRPSGCNNNLDSTTPEGLSEDQVAKFRSRHDQIDEDSDRTKRNITWSAFRAKLGTLQPPSGDASVPVANFPIRQPEFHSLLSQSSFISHPFQMISVKMNTWRRLGVSAELMQGHRALISFKVSILFVDPVPCSIW